MSEKQNEVKEKSLYDSIESMYIFTYGKEDGAKKCTEACRKYLGRKKPRYRKRKH